MLEDALGHLVRGIVDHPDDVAVRERSGRRGRSLEVRVHPEYMGRVIGRSGRTATALRTVVSTLSTDGHVRIDFLDVDERPQCGGTSASDRALPLVFVRSPSAQTGSHELINLFLSCTPRPSVTPSIPPIAPRHSHFHITSSHHPPLSPPFLPHLCEDEG